MINDIPYIIRFLWILYQIKYIWKIYGGHDNLNIF